jgi:uncharacterized repeat protein (TIGR03803 family)
MKTRLALCIFLVLPTIFAHASSQPVVAYTFVCNGNAAQRTGQCPQGGRPNTLIQGTDGNFYGTAQVSYEGPQPQGGNVFSLTPKGTLKVLHTFVESNSYAGGNVPISLVRGPDGLLYGVTLLGGITGVSICPEGCGVVFRLNTDGSEFQVLHEFCSQANCTDGIYPETLVIGGDGNIYGATGAGGTGTCDGEPACGTLFQITPSTGAYAVVFNFNYATDGEYPWNLIAASDGTLYGITIGALPTTLFHYTEANGTFEAFPMAFPLFNTFDPSSGRSLIEGPNGAMFGLYGIYAVDGTGLFQSSNEGSNLQLFPFFTQMPDTDPAQMLLGSDGNFYLADEAGSDNYGDIKQLSPATGSVTHAWNFFSKRTAVGAFPVALIESSDGLLWGTTIAYGTATTGHFGDGVIFSLNLGLPAK